MADLADADIVLSGHSHFVFSKKVGKTLFINPGSVGRPEGTGGKATYSILRFGDKSVKIENHEVEYDMEKTISALHKAKLPEDFVRMLQQGKNLTQLQKGHESLTQKQRDEQLDSVMEFAQHTHQVTKLALKLFDELKELHKMSVKERFILHCASLLHDIGWKYGQKSHHKRALNMIIQATDLPFDLHQRTIIGLIARYHRKAMPKSSHRHFRNLSLRDKHVVQVLAGILRAADGLDRSHLSIINDLNCTVSAEKILIKLDAKGTIISEIDTAFEKSDLLKAVFDKEVIFETAV